MTTEALKHDDDADEHEWNGETRWIDKRNAVETSSTIHQKLRAASFLHHSNIVPWQLLCEEKGAKLRVAPINEDGDLVLEEFEPLLGPRTKIVAVGHI